MASEGTTKLQKSVSDSEVELTSVSIKPSPHAPPLSTTRVLDAVSNATFWKSMTAMTCCMLFVFSIAVAGLAVAVASWRPEVLLTRQPWAPAGYYYAGATYQGSGNWVPNKPSLPVARSDLVAVPVPSLNEIYLIGGIDGSGTVRTDNLQFDPVTEVYTSVAPLPAPRYRMGAAAIGNVVYIAGGVEVQDGPPTETAFAFNVSSNTWTSIANMSIARSDLALASYNGKLYAIGGYGVDYVMTVSGSLVEEYDPATNTWTVRASMPTPRGDLQAIAFGSFVFAVGGWNDIVNNFVPTTEAYNPATNTWSTYANMLVPKGDFAITRYRNEIVSVGGEVWSGYTAPCPWDPSIECNINQTPTHDLLSFNPNTLPASEAEYGGVNSPGGVAPLNTKPGVWVPRSPMPGARFRFAAAANDIAQAVFVFGGQTQDGSVVNTVTAFYDTEQAPVFMHYKK